MTAWLSPTTQIFLPVLLPVEVLVEVTGTVAGINARVVLKAIEHRKHVVLVNAELDSTLGPILKHRADQAGVVLTPTRMAKNRASR